MIQTPTPVAPGLLDGISSFFAGLVSGLFGNASDPIIGTWEIYPTNLTMRYDVNGTAVLLDPVTGYFAVGHWEKVGEDEYHLYSRKGGESAVLFYNPLQDALYTEDLTTVFFKLGDAR